MSNEEKVIKAYDKPNDLNTKNKKFNSTKDEVVTEKETKKSSRRRGRIRKPNEFIMGYGLRQTPDGRSTLDEVVFSGKNTVVIGGVQFAFEKLFGVKGPLTIPTLYSKAGIGKADSSASTSTYQTPTGSVAEIHRPGHLGLLFGVGITGTSENDVTVYPVDYRESGIDMNVVNTDGATIEGTMIPFRYTTDALSDTDKVNYFGKVTDSGTGYTKYYLKKFDTDPVIRNIYSTGEDLDEDSETDVTDADVWTNRVGDNAIESFTEFLLRISHKDVKEWFSYLEQEDRSRINTIALFTGEYIVEASDTDMGDYRDCTMFSKLNIPTEYLSLSKDLCIIYRVYGI